MPRYPQLEQYAAATKDAMARTLAAAPAHRVEEPNMPIGKAVRSSRLHTEDVRKAASSSSLNNQARRVEEVQKASAGQKVPNGTQIREAGGGVGGYLKAWKKLNG